MRVLLRVLLLLGVPLLIGAVALHYYAEGGRYVETENAYVKAHIVAVSAEVSGRVAEVAVRDYEEKYEDGSSAGRSHKKGEVTYCEMKTTQSLVDRDGEKP